MSETNAGWFVDTRWMFGSTEQRGVLGVSTLQATSAATSSLQADVARVDLLSATAAEFGTATVTSTLHVSGSTHLSGKVSARSDVVAAQRVSAGTDVVAARSTIAGGALHAGTDATAERSTIAGGALHAGTDVTATRSSIAGGAVHAGTDVTATLSSIAGRAVHAGVSVTAGSSLQAPLAQVGTLAASALVSTPVLRVDGLSTLRLSAYGAGPIEVTGSTTAEALLLRGTLDVSGITKLARATIAQLQGPGAVPVGAVLPFLGATAPAKYVLCDGRSLSRTAYPALFAAIGTTFGTTGTADFRMPDMGGRLPRGASVAGATGGSDTARVSSSQLPAHTHTLTGLAHNHGGGASHTHLLNAHSHNFAGFDINTKVDVRSYSGSVSGSNTVSITSGTAGVGTSAGGAAMTDGATMQISKDLPPAGSISAYMTSTNTTANTALSVVTACLSVNYIIKAEV